jgi:hypothetical protein
MTRPIPSALPPALTGVAASRAAFAPAPPAAPGAERMTRTGLDLSAWGRAPASPTVRGDLPYPGSAADAGAVADSIAALLFGRG